MDEKLHNEKFHNVAADTGDLKYLRLIVDNRRYQVRWTNCSERLASATPHQRAAIDISPAGYGIHWPLIDEDLAIDPLLQQAEKLVTGPIVESLPGYVS